MEAVAMMRALVRHPLLVGLGLALAVVAGLSTLYQLSLSPPFLTSRAHTAQVATTRVIISTATGASYNLDTKISTTIPARATLVADLASGSVATAAIARRSGLRPDELAVFGPATGPPAIPVPIAVEATDAAAAAPEPAVLRLEADGALPIVTITVTTADAALSTRIARATRAALAGIVKARSNGGKAAITVQGLGGVTIRPHLDAPKKSMALIGTLGILVCWCAGIVVYDGLRRRPRGPRPVPGPSGRPAASL
jgi:hypothetical protein